MTKILIADDDPEIRDLLKKTLTRRGCEIISAADGQEAVAMARDQKPELIIMDIIMPGAINGIEATRILKADAQIDCPKIMILTGKGGAQGLDEAASAGADAFFSKPSSPLELLRKIDEILA